MFVHRPFSIAHLKSAGVQLGLLNIYCKPTIKSATMAVLVRCLTTQTAFAGFEFPWISIITKHIMKKDYVI